MSQEYEPPKKTRKESNLEAVHRYRQTRKYKETTEIYLHSEAGQAKEKRYRQSSKFKAKEDRYRKSTKGVAKDQRYNLKRNERRKQEKDQEENKK